ncbi:hypothetical protein HHK36_004307 [Tetracentron sinense]|uniref:Uncharacterized protein n=1 Tax=Tetracentron sinense TaxID=13715 RepID=A0A834ZPS1_TETSI|nr:hypothetical protein HHK36_004307 [Tetracentron sinense]
MMQRCFPLPSPSPCYARTTAPATACAALSLARIVVLTLCLPRRKLEMLIAVLVFVMAGCFFVKMSYVTPSTSEVMSGMFIPKLESNEATGDAIALFGALVMTHNLFLHSALVLSRKVPQPVNGINMILSFELPIALMPLVQIQQQ